MPSYKLIYFDARGRAEPARMLFALKGQEFEDHRFSYGEWPTLKKDKKTFPIGQGPVLIIDGTTLLTQSRAIGRYLAEIFGFFGENPLERARINAIVDTMCDIEMLIFPLYFIKDPAKKAEEEKKFKEVSSTRYLSYLDELIKEAGGKYFVGNKMTYADIHTFTWLEVLTTGIYKIEGALDPYPALQAFFKSFVEDSPLTSYLKTRPVRPS